jgi:hypothetical protein
LADFCFDLPVFLAVTMVSHLGKRWRYPEP